MPNEKYFKFIKYSLTDESNLQLKTKFINLLRTRTMFNLNFKAQFLNSFKVQIKGIPTQKKHTIVLINRLRFTLPKNTCILIASYSPRSLDVSVLLTLYSSQYT